MDDVLPGRPYPLGATVQAEGVNFSVFSKHALEVELLLFDHADAGVPSRVIPLSRPQHCTFYYRHALVRGLPPGQLYAYRARGPFVPSQGLRFDGDKLLLDPYARAVAYGDYQREAAKRKGDNTVHALKGVVENARSYDWEGDAPLGRPYTGSVVYEMHVAGFTRHPSSGVDPRRRGTYAGLIDKIPYLQELGITTVELLPVQQFDEQDAAPSHRNYWGYSPIGLFAPHRGYCLGTDPLAPVNEFRDLVKALHRAGIEVILDVVFNHTAEGDESGPTLSMRGLENRAYYMLRPDDRSHFLNYSGCGNTLNANHSIVRRLVMDCLHHWVQDMHVDGFRFDLASVMSRDGTGELLKDPPILWEIESDPVLAGTKIIAEAWDAAGLYQVGSFPGHRWAEWNGQFRDDVRRFVAGRYSETTSKLAARISASRDIYQQPDREPSRSTNFITCHDGFTLNDLCTYDHKHNEANGEKNRDGLDDNYSWNCGVEGPSLDPKIEALRLRQIKNLLTIMLTSQGTPMLLMGDEVRRTQQGNNNGYCQDNEISWFNWDDVQNHAGLLRFVRGLIRFNREHRLFREDEFWTVPGGPEIAWHGVKLGQPDFGPDSHSLAFELTYPDHDEHLHVMLNAYWTPLSFELPVLPTGRHFYRLIDTFLPSPQDFCEIATAPEAHSPYVVQDRSAVVLVGR